MLRRKPLILVGIALVLGVLYLFFTRRPTYPITNEHPTGTRVIAFGDSLTFGTGADPDKSYPAQLGRLLGVDILNKGVAGNTTADALGRLDADVLGNDPRIVLVCLGGNDAIQQLPTDTTVKNLETIIRRIQQRGALVILIGVDVIKDGRLTEAYPELARKTGCPFVPNILGGIFGHMDLMSDVIHPNSAGYAAMAAKIAPVVKKYM